MLRTIHKSKLIKPPIAVASTQIAVAIGHRSSQYCSRSDGGVLIWLN